MLDQWQALIEPYAPSSDWTVSAYNSIVKHYRETGRYYHNMDHVEQLLQLAKEQESGMEDPVAVKLAIWLHDVIYDTYKQNNEKKSADFAVKLLSKTSLEMELIRKVETMIVRTANHLESSDEDDNDTLTFLDMDLSVLAGTRNDYITYMHNIRKEYKWVPEFLYKRNRKKFLNRLLDTDVIFRSGVFDKKMEKKAKDNLKYEVRLL